MSFIPMALRTSLGKVWLTAGLGVGIYFLSRKKADEVSPKVKEALELGAKSMQAAPLTAANHYQVALDELMKANSSPVLVLDVLLRLADACEASKQLPRARDALRFAESLALQLEEKKLVDTTSSDRITKAFLPNAVADKPALAGVTKEAIAHKHLVALTRRADLEMSLGNQPAALSLLRSAQASALEHFRPTLLQRAFSSVVLPPVMKLRGRGQEAAAVYPSPPSIPRDKREILAGVAGTFFNLAHCLAERAEKAEEEGKGDGDESFSSPLEQAGSQEMLASAFMALVLVTAAARAAHKELLSALDVSSPPSSSLSAASSAALPQLPALPSDSPLIVGKGKGPGSLSFVPLSVLPLGLPDSVEQHHSSPSSSVLGTATGAAKKSGSSSSSSSAAAAAAAGHGLGPTTLSCSLSYDEMLAIAELCAQCSTSAFAVTGKLAAGTSPQQVGALKGEIEMLCDLVSASAKLWATAAWRLHAQTLAQQQRSGLEGGASATTASSSAPLR